jgi:hypothetical protein
MNSPPRPEAEKVDKNDAGLGAVEGDRPEDSPQQGNPNAPALDEQGLPKDKTKICEDVIGANVDGTQG